MAKAHYISTTVGSVTTVRRIGPPGNFPIAEIIPLGHTEPIPPPARRPRRVQKKKGRRKKR